MKQLKRILALIGVVLLLGMYVLTMIFAVQKSEFAAAAFRGALGCTILVPVFLYLFLLVARAVRPEKSAVIDGLIYRADDRESEIDGSRLIFQKEWEQSLLKGGYRLHAFSGNEQELAALVKGLEPKEQRERLLYIDTDPRMVKAAQQLGLPAMRFSDAETAEKELEKLGIRL